MVQFGSVSGPESAASERFGLAFGPEPAALVWFGFASGQSGSGSAVWFVFAWKIVPELVRLESVGYFVRLHPEAGKNGFVVPGAWREQSRKLA